MGRLKSFLYLWILFIEFPLFIIPSYFFVWGYISVYVCLGIWITIALLFIYRIICYIFDRGIADRINYFFVLLELPYTGLVLIHQKAAKKLIKNYSCKEKVKKLMKTSTDLIPKLKENKKYIAFTHEEIASRLEKIKGINVLTKKLIYSKSLIRIQKEIYQCEKKRCEKYKECFYVDSDVRSFYFLKFTYKLDN